MCLVKHRVHSLDLLFVLKQEAYGFGFCQKQMVACDQQMEQYLRQREDRSQGAFLPEEKRKTRANGRPRIISFPGCGCVRTTGNWNIPRSFALCAIHAKPRLFLWPTKHRKKPTRASNCLGHGLELSETWTGRGV
jgi:hypothetical protein